MRDLYLWMILLQKRIKLCRSPSTLAPLGMKTIIARASILRFLRNLRYKLVKVNTISLPFRITKMYQTRGLLSESLSLPT